MRSRDNEKVIINPDEDKDNFLMRISQELKQKNQDDSYQNF
jgi:hypothetical protein